MAGGTGTTGGSGAGWRMVGDPDGDAAIAEHLRLHPLTEPRDLVRHVVATLDPTRGAGTAGPRLRALADPGAGALPAWADEARLRRGQELFETHGLPIAAALFCASLPVAYRSADGAQVIAITGELVSSTHRRVAETAQLLTAVMDLGDLDDGHPLAPDTPGFRAAVGVRLMHACVRAFITLDPEAAARYRPSRPEVPINQEDLLGTLLTFTTVVFDALERLGVVCDEADLEAYLHTWCVVGHLLGIDPQLLPSDLATARALDARIRAEQQRSSAEGRRLMAALRTEMRENMPWGLRGLPDALVHQLIGPEAARDLGVPEPGWTRVVVGLTRRGARLWSTAPGRGLRLRVSRAFARVMIRSYISRGREGERPPWDFDRYARTWRLEPWRARTIRGARATRQARRARRRGA